jgi:hypothetical protein
MAPVPTETMTVQNPVEFRPAKNTTHREDLDEHPFNRIWRGNKEGTVTVAGVPKFTDKYEEREWIKASVYYPL